MAAKKTKEASTTGELQALTKSVQKVQLEYAPVKTPEQRDEAVRALATLKALRKRIEDYWTEPKKAAYSAWKQISSKESEMLGPVAAAMEGITKRINEFLSEQARLQRELQQKADREKQAQIEREEKALAKKLEKAKASGNEDRIEEIKDQIAQIDRTPEIVVVEKGVKLDEAQLSSVTDYEISVTDVRAFCAEIAAGRAPVGVVEFKTKALKDFVRLNQLTAFPGLAIQQVQKARLRA